jgi:cytochrome c peroxidase
MSRRFGPEAALGLLLAWPCHGAADAALGLPALHEQRATASQALTQLGKKLFFDVRLSADGKVSCAHCHVPERAFTDGRATSSGHRGQRGTRNAPSLLNVAYLDSLFWDGRAADLESQALAPLLNSAEHALSNEQAIVDVVRGDAVYLKELKQAFGASRERIDAQMIGAALAAYERTLVAGESSFDRFLYGADQTALSAEAKGGLELFRGRAQCVACHPIGESNSLFTDGGFHMTPTGLPKAVTTDLASLAARVRASEGSALEQLIATDPNIAALGRFLVTRNPADIGKFKTPSLRNVALTAPYMHDGSVPTLEQAVDLELYNRAGALRYPIILTIAERRALVEFLKALSSSKPEPLVLVR